MLLDAFGPTWTILLMLGAALLLAARRLYLDWRADRLTNAALDEKERTVQRVANQEREWRIYFMMQHGGLSRAEAESLIMENVFSTPQEAREALEKPKRLRERIRRRKEPPQEEA